MAASLDTIPTDILQYIAYLLATASLSNGVLPQGLLPLLLTNSDIYKALNVNNCPHLYANIFRATFDFDHDLHSQLKDSVITAELQYRHRFLWRTWRKDFTSNPSMDELWAAMRMVLENAGRNSKLLASYGFPTFIMTFARHCLSRAATNTPLSSDHSITMTMAMWLLCITLTHEHLVETSEAMRNEIKNLLRFPTTYSGITTYPLHEEGQSEEIAKSVPLVYLADGDHIALLERATPIIILIFALNEVVPISVPFHVPETRAIAIAAQRSGPTAEDLLTVVDIRTPLYAETGFARVLNTESTTYLSDPAHQAVYGARLRPFLRSTYLGPKQIPRYVYTPGSLAGLWEGNFMISGKPRPINPESPLVLGDFQCLKPMQCAITEYLCFSPHLPMPPDFPINRLESVIKSKESGYEKYSVAINEGSSARRDPSHALDIVIVGKTLHDHEQAWNGFRFAGRVRSDGFIAMYREPKGSHDREGLGSWIFEGHLRYGAAFVGQWRSSIPTTTCDLRGIFSLRKTDEGWQE